MAEEDIEMEDLDLQEEQTEDKASTDPEQGIDDLKKQIEEANARAEEAERKAQEMADQKARAEATATDAVEGRIQMAEEKLDSDMEAAKNNAKAIQAKLREAFDAGDSEASTDLTDQLLEAKLTIKQLEGHKHGLNNWKTQYQQQKEAQSQRKAEEIGDDDLKTLTPAARKWVDEHPRFKTDKAYREKAERSHYAALGEGIRADSKEYFDFINGRLEEKPKEEEGSIVVDTQEKPAAKKPPIASAPVSRGGQNKGSNGSGRYRTLTAAEVEAAEISGMTPSEYAKYKYGTQ